MSPVRRSNTNIDAAVERAGGDDSASLSAPEDLNRLRQFYASLVREDALTPDEAAEIMRGHEADAGRDSAPDVLPGATAEGQR